MSYALKNTLAFAMVLLLTLLGGGYWTRVRMGGQLEQLREVESQRSKRLDGLNRWYDDYESARVALEDLKKKYAGLHKAILPESSTASAFAYLNDLMALDRSSIRFNFTFKEDVEEKEYGYSVYAVSGTGSFRDIYNLIWRIEHERPLVKIASIRIQEQQVKEEDRTRSEMLFDMVLHVYHSQRTMPPREETMAYDIRDPFVGYNPFYPLVQPELPPNTEALVEIEGATVEAMTADRVVMLDAKGRRATLRIGDRVYLGRLRAIRVDARQAVFVLNKGGIVDRVVLEMGIPSVASAGSQADGRTSAPVRAGEIVRFLGVEVSRSGEVAQVTVRNTGSVPYQHFGLAAPPRIVLDVKPAIYAWDRTRVKEATMEVEDPVIREIRASQFELRPPMVRVVIELEEQVRYSITHQDGEIVVDIKSGEAPSPMPESAH